MNTEPRVIAILAILALLSASAAHAHHAFAPVYDGSKTVEIQGVVTSFKLVNPHATMAVDVPDPAGNVATWTIEFAGRLNLVNAGWTDDCLFYYQVYGRTPPICGKYGRSFMTWDR